MYVPELPLCPDAVVFNVVEREFEAVFDVDELINVGSPRGPSGTVGDAVRNGGEMVMLEGSPD
jgi:hypothetical protein